MPSADMFRAKIVASAVALLPLSLFSRPVAAVPTPLERSSTDIRSILTDPSRDWSAGTILSFPSSPAFANATERWSIFSPPTYEAAIRPGTESDIVQVIKLANNSGIPFLSRGSGHGYAESLGNFQGGISLDLSQWNSVEVDSAAQTLTVGPGAIYDDIFDPLYDAGFYMQTGSCSCPSVIGVALGGGVGRLMVVTTQGELGLTIDALESVRLVGADGIAKTVSATSYPDLFWAVRGAGANFGVVTSATFNVQTLASNNDGNVWMVDFHLPAEKSQEYFDIIQQNYSPMPTNLAGVVVLKWNATSNATEVASDWIFYGTEEEGRKALAPILELDASFSTAVLPWNKITAISGGGYDPLNCQPNKPRNNFSLNQKAWNADTWQAGFEMIEDFFEQVPGGRDSQILLELFSNAATAAVSEDETCWPWRDTWGFFQVQFSYEAGDTATQDAANTLGPKIRDKFAETSGYSDQVVFLNYARGDEAPENIYGADKLPRLIELKKKYDPHNLFSFPHPIPSSYP
ncbi:FAD/FMN-containing dehydrogenase [Geosmithia morbida]|uniref:FAD/FMN-containing dehydrogenase n=1 Tax=Geosmithia morbida TaxID=1094350 RepID=A0A9P4YZC1_9HYPO|nr:FAD/FMN-containing dehydrogenase [Geosmithia morbida]KAF4125700.1 FAD/FMN-containing dehydrogenase [Geosmithia morbida]